jgi:hypothetical protein
MKLTLIAALIATATAATSAGALTFDYQAAFPSEEYIAGYDVRNMTFAPVVADGRPSSRETLYLAANVDGIAPNDFRGVIVETGPTEISLYEVYRGSPEGGAYAGYHERFPVGTDWAQVQRDFRQDRMDNIAADLQATGNDS